MKILSKTPEITFDDVLLLPQFSKFSINQENKIVDLSTKISKKLSIDIPIISSPMPGVTEDEMAITIGKMGGIGFIHSFQSFDRQLNQVNKVKKQKIKVAATVIAQSEDALRHIEKLLNLGTDLICLYTYHSLNQETIKFIKEIKKRFPKIQLSTGPIATKEAVKRLSEAGIDSLNVGVGPGSHCTTRLMTGVGRPQLSAVLECSKEAKKYGIPIISEGGIKYPGDISKALAFGASAVMIGGMFSGTAESPGEIFYKDKQKFKASWGMCSNTAMTHQHLKIKYNINFIVSVKKYIKSILPLEKFKEKNSEKKTLFEEGTEGLIKYKGSVVPIIKELIGGTRRSMWYQGSTNIGELQKKSKVILTSKNTLNENIPRI